MIVSFIFTDMETYYDRQLNKALNEFVEFCNTHKEYKLISVFKRRMHINNSGNGEEFYNLDAIFEVEDKKEVLK